MADSCIVCLGDLAYESNPYPQHEASGEHSLSQNESTSTPKESEIIAHLLPCGHNLHDQCLKPWVERANSCPMCRAVFHEVERRSYVNGPVLSTYAVDDKQQAAEVDPELYQEHDLFDMPDEEPEPCLICGEMDSIHEVMYCDGCDHTVHVFCAGYVDSPEVWHCEACQKEWEAPTSSNLRSTRSSTRHNRRHRSRILHQPRQTAAWARVWQTVWTRLNLDLDFPYDDDDGMSGAREHGLARAANQAAWRRRYNVASRQGVARTFREAAPPLITGEHQREPESPEELRAWNAFDKARDLQDGDNATSSRRKRKSGSATPRSTVTPPPGEEERPFKRPRTKQSQPAHRRTTMLESSGHATARPQATSNGPNFFSSLVDEIQQQSAPQPTITNEVVLADGQISPPLTSPAVSPLVTATHRASSPASPTPLSLDQKPANGRSPLRPISPVESAYSPYSPVHNSNTSASRQEHARGRQRDSKKPRSRALTAVSPSSHLSYSTKTEIQRMVKAALGSRYRNKEMTKEQYTNINRIVSRMLYEQIGDAGALSEQVDRDKWQAMATNAVAKELEKLVPGQC